MKIDKIIVSAYRYDQDWLRINLASIRYWYPTMPIFVLKDKFQGDFNLAPLQKKLKIQTYPTQKECFGWGMAKIYAIINETKGRYLLLDADTVMVGKIIDHLEQFNEDILVGGYKTSDVSSRILKRDYIDVEKVRKEYDPNFEYIGFGFNTGQIVLNGGLFELDDFTDFVDFNQCPLKLKRQNLFPYTDQGILNYVIAKKAQENKLKVRYIDNFFLWSDLPFVKNELSLENIKTKQGYNGIVHWAGTKRFLLKNNTRYDLLKFYQKYYYSKFKFKNAEYIKDLTIKWFLYFEKRYL